MTRPPGPEEGEDWSHLPPLSPSVSGGNYNGMGLLSWGPGQCTQDGKLSSVLIPTGPSLPFNPKAEQLYPDAWGLRIELGAPGCLEALKTRGRALLGGPGIPIWKAWARHSPKPLTASLYNSWAESAVLGKSQSAPGACRHRCVQKLQVAPVALPVCTGDGARAEKPHEPVPLEGFSRSSSLPPPPGSAGANGDPEQPRARPKVTEAMC